MAITTKMVKPAGYSINLDEHKLIKHYTNAPKQDWVKIDRINKNEIRIITSNGAIERIPYGFVIDLIQLYRQLPKDDKGRKYTPVQKTLYNNVDHRFKIHVQENDYNVYIGYFKTKLPAVQQVINFNIDKFVEFLFALHNN